MTNGRMATPPASAGWIILAAVLAAGLTGCGRAPKAGDVKTITLPGGAAMEMVWCPPGTFLMGSPESEEGAYDETQHQVTLTKGFWMAKYEVTEGQWKSVMGTAWFREGDDFPAEGVGWDDAQEFCQKAGLRLPTEAEWEYACRAGSTGPYGGTGRLEEMGWYWGEARWKHPVGQKKANAWGLHDMHGNVSEWCSDAYGRYPDGAVTDPSTREPAGDRVGRVLRGGSWHNDAMLCRSAARRSSAPAGRGGSSGFRPVFSEKATAKAKPGAEDENACENLEAALEKSETPGKPTVGGETESRVAPDIAETEGPEYDLELAGMFGARFGKVMAESAECITNNAGVLDYEFIPPTPLDGFGAYHLFTTPATRQVFQIRAVRRIDGMSADEVVAARYGFGDQYKEYKRLYGDSGGETEEDVDKVFEDTVRLLERRFKRDGEPWENQDRRLFIFANSPVVVVTKMEDRIFIDAIDLKLQELAQQEVGEVIAR